MTFPVQKGQIQTELCKPKYIFHLAYTIDMFINYVTDQSPASFTVLSNWQPVQWLSVLGLVSTMLKRPAMMQPKMPWSI